MNQTQNSAVVSLSSLATQQKRSEVELKSFIEVKSFPGNEGDELFWVRFGGWTGKRYLERKDGTMAKLISYFPEVPGEGGKPALISLSVCVDMPDNSTRWTRLNVRGPMATEINAYVEAHQRIFLQGQGLLTSRAINDDTRIVEEIQVKGDNIAIVKNKPILRSEYVERPTRRINEESGEPEWGLSDPTDRPMDDVPF
jgi:hypothetical protein